jgi:hypothetical protein
MVAFGKNSSGHLLSGCVSRSARLSLFAELSREFPAFDYYDADIPLTLRFAARIGVSLLGRCRIDLIDNHVAKVEALDHPWLLDPAPLPLRMLELSPEVDPASLPPRQVRVRYGRASASVRILGVQEMARKCGWRNSCYMTKPSQK